MRNLLAEKSKDFITAVDEKNIIVVKELTEKDGAKELEKMAKEMLDMLKEDTRTSRSVLHMVRSSATSRKYPSPIRGEACAWRRKIFFAEKDIVAFTTLNRPSDLSAPIPVQDVYQRDFRGNRRMILMRDIDNDQ